MSSMEMMEVMAEPVYVAECESVPNHNDSWMKVKMLYDAGLLSEWSNFSECLPVCGLCQPYKGDTTYLTYNLIVTGFILPCIGVFGLFGNSMSAFLYSRKRLQSSTNWYLCALGCSDCCTIITALFLFFGDTVRRYSAAATNIFGRFSPMVYPLGLAAQTWSVYFTVAAATDCFVHVCMPLSAKKWFDAPLHVIEIIVSVVAFGIAYNVPHCFEAIVVHCWHEGFQVSSLAICPHPFRFNHLYITIYYKYMYTVFIAVGPLLLLIVLNTCIIIATILASRKKKRNTLFDASVVVNSAGCDYGSNENCGKEVELLQLTSGLNGKAGGVGGDVICSDNHNNTITNNNNNNNNNNSTAHSYQEEPLNDDGDTPGGDDTITLILVVLLFIICNLAALLLNIFEESLQNLIGQDVNYVVDGSNVMVVLNSSANFLIYYRFSDHFRATFWTYCNRKCLARCVYTGCCGCVLRCCSRCRTNKRYNHRTVLHSHSQLSNGSTTMQTGVVLDATIEGDSMTLVNNSTSLLDDRGTSAVKRSRSSKFDGPATNVTPVSVVYGNVGNGSHHHPQATVTRRAAAPRAVPEQFNLLVMDGPELLI